MRDTFNENILGDDGCHKEANTHLLIYRPHGFNMLSSLLNWTLCTVICKSTRVDY